MPRLAGSLALTLLYCNQQTIPEAFQHVIPEENITITDPRHPLYGQTFPLVGIHETQLQDIWYVVELVPGVHRRVSEQATDRSKTPLRTTSNPLGWDSVRQLLATYAVMTVEPVEGTEYEPADRKTNEGKRERISRVAVETDRTGTGLGGPDGPATAKGIPGPGANVPRTAAEGEVR
jgi:sulfite reductase beta subunit-like hemoprotein